MFSKGGMAYVYLCYGIHHLFNVVTNIEGMADAILIRALEPIQGVEEMLSRRNMHVLEKRLTSGPGVLTKAMGITTEHYGLSLLGNVIWFEESGREVPENRIKASKRIGVDYAGEDALKPWRFYIKENGWVSRL
jgi:DNA-3-methyladenine glycosylase